MALETMYLWSAALPIVYTKSLQIQLRKEILLDLLSMEPWAEVKKALS